MIDTPPPDQDPPKRPAHGAPDTDSLSEDEIWDLAASSIDRFCEAWRGDAPTPPQIDDYLPFSAGEAHAVILGELVKIDLEQRARIGKESGSVDDYLKRYPELRPLEEELRHEAQLLSGGSLKNSARSSSARRDSTLSNQTLSEATLSDSALPSSRTTLVDSLKMLFEKRSKREDVEAALSSLEVGDQLDDFDLVQSVGSGSFARVFLARQRSLLRLVAIKISPNQGAEPETLARLHHPGIIRVFDQKFLKDRDLRLLYMEYAPGGTLQDLLNQLVDLLPKAELGGPVYLDLVESALVCSEERVNLTRQLPVELNEANWPETVAWVGIQLARALDYAHRQGVLHRDLKPANVLFGADYAPKLADFNVSFTPEIQGDLDLQFGGSLAYMSPEQLEACHPRSPRKSTDLDERSDLYALGVVIAELLGLERPFKDEALGRVDRTIESMLAIRVDRRQLEERLIELGVDPEFRSILLAVLEPDRDQRTTTLEGLATSLELYRDPEVRTFLAEAREGWRQSLRRHAIPAVVIATLIPNLAAAIFNYFYNRSEIVAHSAQFLRLFEQTQLAINAIAFPIGIALIALLVRPLANCLASIDLAWDGTPESKLPESNETSGQHPDSIAKTRLDSLRLGDRVALICLAEWLIAGLAYPLSLYLAGAELSLHESVHFGLSLALCGLVAASYPFFLVSGIVTESLYPHLLQRDTIGPDDNRRLDQLGQRATRYLYFAVTVPMLSAALLIGVGSTSRIPLLILTIGSLVGFVLSLRFVKRLRAVTEVLARAIEINTRDFRSHRG